ncbi:uncharacterized protein SPPG_00326 [Spizellomyces punctatus DAOM BR117]|uniref:peptidylprolyl isomerase n=1 Tax=Spizellomyces punctatus (strain DAOM BR117) TaxID=645134 RepID=A0A0L0HU37_SPIPD|nr:uncharacterized protein SPPG_00326 [Spizellomyces punctatus DAOM BR117]KND04608.1 hypothetical protein SPPG_00326 [Spizellomyces punctatus DAOM BR117]|eukprot:XP_016612647.1 hypothetical protein SPPG_00326 [Spizellomyces punctatus DAOM BR117]
MATRGLRKLPGRVVRSLPKPVLTAFRLALCESKHRAPFLLFCIVMMLHQQGQEDDNLSILPTSTFMNQLSSENELVDQADQADLLEMVEKFDQWARINGHASHEEHSEKQENGNSKDEGSRIEETALDPNEFMQSGPLIPIICNLLRKLYPARAEPLSQRITSEDCKFLTQELRNFQVQASHSYRRRYRITELTSQTSNSIVLDVDGKAMTVREYFLERYGVTLEYPDFPCVAIKKPNGWSYLPCELCEIVEGQRISTKFWEIKEPTLTPASSETQENTKRKKQENNVQPQRKSTLFPSHPREHSLYRRTSTFGVAPSTWVTRMALSLCLRCGHPSHKLRQCALYPIIGEELSWKDVPDYVEMGVSIPTVKEKWGIEESEWFKRLEHGACAICEGKHRVRDCEVLRNVDGKVPASTSEDNAEIMEDTTKKNQGAAEESEQSVQTHLDESKATESGNTSVESPNSKETADSEQSVQTLLDERTEPTKIPVESTKNRETEDHAATDVPDQSLDTSLENTLPTEMPSTLANTDQPPNLTCQVDVEGYTNILPTGKLKKKILKPGSGPAVEPQSFVKVHYEGWVDGPGGMMFDSSWDRGSTFDFTVGEGDVIPGWDMAVQTMKMGEEAEFIVDSELAYGEKGYDSVIPPHAALRFTIRVMHVDPPQSTLPARISEAIALKNAGNVSFQSQDYPTAVKSYRSALQLLKHTWNAPPAQELELQFIRTALFSNLAAGLLHMGQHTDAIRVCREGLWSEPESVKLLISLARGLKSSGEFAEALQILEKAELFDPNNPYIASERIQIQVIQRRLAKQEKEMYTRMMSALSS